MGQLLLSLATYIVACTGTPAATLERPQVSLSGAVDGARCTVTHHPASYSGPAYDSFSVWIHTTASGLGTWGALRVDIYVSGIYYKSYGWSGDAVNDERVLYIHPGAKSSIIPHSDFGYWVEARLYQYVAGWGEVYSDAIAAPHPK